MKKATYEKKLRELQTELANLQDWVVETGYRAVVVFEGRDAAGKGGVIKAMTEKVSPRVFRVWHFQPLPTGRKRKSMASDTSSISLLPVKS